MFIMTCMNYCERARQTFNKRTTLVYACVLEQFNNARVPLHRDSAQHSIEISQSGSALRLLHVSSVLFLSLYFMHKFTLAH